LGSLGLISLLRFQYRVRVGNNRGSGRRLVQFDTGWDSSPWWRDGRGFGFKREFVPSLSESLTDIAGKASEYGIDFLQK